MLYCTLRQGAVVPVPSRCLYRRQACLYESPTGLQSILWERACPRWYRRDLSKFAVLVSHPPVESAPQSGLSRRSALGQKWPSCLVHIKPSMSSHRSMVHTVPPSLSRCFNSCLLLRAMAVVRGAPSGAPGPGARSVNRRTTATLDGHQGHSCKFIHTSA